MKLLWGTSQCNSQRTLTPQQVALHEALVGHFAEQLSQSTNTSQQVALHEALVGHFTVQLSQSTDASASGTA